MQTYNDGVCGVYGLVNAADAGDKPLYRLATKYDSARYEERTVGIHRFYAAKQAQVNIERVLRMPLLPLVLGGDIVVIGREQYRIDQVQYIRERFAPTVMDIALVRVGVPYEYV